MSNIFFVSDLHFGHSNIILYSNRPYSSVEEMNAALIKNWNAVVNTNDTVYHLGDFAFLKLYFVKNILRQLNGTKHFILGNHDQVIKDNQKELIRLGLLASVQDYLKINAGKQNIVLFHYGMRVWDGSHRGTIHLYGHSHSTLPPHGKSVDVGVDCKEITHEYRPIHIDEVVSYMDKRKFQSVDHHKE
jgi:calcineurin-like phosphoesterase family protein